MEEPTFRPRSSVPQLDFADFQKAGREEEAVGTFFESCFKILKDIHVWSPTMDNTRLELVVVSNCAAVYMALTVSKQYERAPTLKQMKQNICQSLERAHQCITKKTCLFSKAPKTYCIEEHLKRIVEAVKDPIAHFRSMSILGQVVTLCGLTCLFVRQQEQRQAIVRETFSIFEELISLLCKDVLQEPLPYKNGHFGLDSNTEGEAPSVSDLVTLVLAACTAHTRVCPVTFKHWSWLDDILHCKNLMSQQDFMSAMEHLEVLLNSQLDAEIRSMVLSLFAQCYMHQGCPQLSLQTYKTALKADQGNTMILYHLAGVYRSLGQSDLELESLNIFVRFLTDKHLRGKRPPLDLHFDALVYSISEVMPSIGLPVALHHFARRCVQYRRYAEASEQYMALLKLLEEGSDEAGVDESREPLNVQEIVVEAAEASALAQQTEQCLSLFDQFYSVLVANDTVFKADSMDALSLNCDTGGISQSQERLLFSPRLNRLDHCLLGSGVEKDQGEPLNRREDIGARDVSASTSFINLCELTRRKRRRSLSASSDMNLEEEGGGGGTDTESSPVADPWRSTCLTVRLLLSKADVLVASYGHTQEVMGCLQRAKDLLLTDQTPIFKQTSATSDTADKVTHSPSSKRRRTTQDTPGFSTSHSDSPGKQQTAEARDPLFDVSKLWSSVMVKVAERMVVTSQSLGKTLSARNSARLLLQLDPGNQTAQRAMNKKTENERIV